MSDLYVIATLVAKPDQADRLRRMLTEGAAAFRQEDGCISYDVHEDVNQPGGFRTHERWRDRAAADAHMATPLMNSLLPQLPEILGADFTQDVLTPVSLS